jgi:hypothetical protein
LGLRLISLWRRLRVDGLLTHQIYLYELMKKWNGLELILINKKNQKEGPWVRMAHLMKTGRILLPTQWPWVIKVIVSKYISTHRIWVHVYFLLLFLILYLFLSNRKLLLGNWSHSITLTGFFCDVFEPYSIGQSRWFWFKRD